MSYSLAQAKAYSFLADKRGTRDLSRHTVASLLGSRGEIKKVQKLLKEWSK